jgi:hypothetical protein
MYLAYIPPAVFIERLLRASVGDDELLGYGAVAVLLARTADAVSVQEKFERDWSSIHDVTGAEVLVVTPVTASDNPAEVYKGASGAFTSGFTFRTSLQDHVRKAFPAGGEFWDSVPVDSSWREVSTRAVTDTLHHFGMPESITPCLLVFVFWDEELLVVAVDDLFNPYSFFKDAVQCDPSSMQSIAELRKQITDLDRDLLKSKRRLGRQVRRKAALRAGLFNASSQLPEVSGVATQLVRSLEQEPVGVPAPEDVERLAVDLKVAVKSARFDKGIADNLIASLRAATRANVDAALLEQRHQLVAKLDELHRARRFGASFVQAAGRQGIVETGASFELAPSGAGLEQWRTRLLARRNRASSLISLSSPSRRTD